MPELRHHPVPLRRALRRCANNDRVYSATEALGGNALLVAPALRAASIADLTHTLHASHSLTMDATVQLPHAKDFVGYVLAFGDAGVVTTTDVPKIAELLCGGSRTGIYVVSACKPHDPHATAPEALADRFCRVVRSALD